ncbi:uncharacterized protein LOC124707156 isoform X2 [Lolium rigidum]|nr:uncharacterized protein LOC124707156 isoform X2 [Lolium rigidum]
MGTMPGSKKKSAMPPMPSCGTVVSNKRKMAAVSGSAASLPDEMVEEVLLRLPVKSIVRFRAVCRSWSAMFSSEEFCCLHRAMLANAAPTATPKLLYVSPAAGFDSTAMYSCSPSDPRDNLLFTLDCARGNFVEVVTPAPCHGLTLLYDAVPPAYYICNAATREVTRLPPYLDMSRRSSAGLGFDARTRKYKVVRLINAKPKEKEMIKCEVYTAGGGYGDRWRPATREVPFGMRRFVLAAVANAARHKLPPVFANGSLHWLVNPKSFLSWPRAAVISFSVAEETFTYSRSPSFWASEQHQPPLARVSVEHLVEMDNQLCMVRDLRNNPNCSTLEIWKLLDYSSGNWSLSHQIDLSGQVARDFCEPQIVRVIGSVGNCRSVKKIIIATSKRMVDQKFENKVHSYDPRSKALETILSVRETHTSRITNTPSSRFGLFEESLAAVHKTDREIALSSTLAKATKEILLRLPAKSVIQTKLVCKQWLSLTESQSFIQSYLEHKNMDKRPKVMLVGKGTGQSGFSFAPLNRCLPEDHRHIVLLDTKMVCSKPCHGLNLISTEENDYLYNPCTGFHKVYCNQAQAQAEQHAFAVGNKNVGLGFDLLTCEHFLVEIFYKLKDFESRQYALTCELWRCKSGGYAQNSLVPPLPMNDMPPAYLEGMLYWMSEPRLGQKYERAIISFDIATNAFGVIPCPPCIAVWNGRCHQHAFVVELEGVLCAVLADPVGNNLDIWKLKHGEWGIAYIVHLEAWPDYSLETNVVVPLAVDPVDGRILLNTGKKLGLYDPVERTIQNLCSLDGAVACSKDQQSAGKPNIMGSEIRPLVPMLYEDNLACYPRVGKTRWM